MEPILKNFSKVRVSLMKSCKALSAPSSAKCAVYKADST